MLVHQWCEATKTRFLIAPILSPDALPFEIRCLIFCEMHDPASATALGLTCKAMYSIYSGFFWDLVANRPTRRYVRLNMYTRALNYMPLHELIRDFFPKDLVYWDGGYSGTPKFVTKERLAELLKADEIYWEMVRSTRSY
jgi:hypothetical protein